MILQIPMRSNTDSVDYYPCYIVGVEQVPFATFLMIRDGTLKEFSFSEKWKGLIGDVEYGHLGCLLVLNDKNDDGLVVGPADLLCARCSAYVSNAKLLYDIDRYPSMEEFMRGMFYLADKYAELAVECQVDGEFRLNYQDLELHSGFNFYDEGFLLKMLSSRPEIDSIESDTEEYCITIAPEFHIAEDETNYRVLTQEDVEIMSAKHFLFLHDSGGEEADFSHCFLQGLNLHKKELNGAIFDGAKIVNCDLRDCGLCFASMKNAQIIQCKCAGMTAEEAQFSNAKFISSNLFGAYFTHSDFSQAKIRDCNLADASLQNCCIDGTDFGDTELRETNTNGCMNDHTEWEEAADIASQPTL